MKSFEDYLDEMGYNWNDFDRNYEMLGLIEQYADKKANQVTCKSKQCDHPINKRASFKSHGKNFCWKCGKHI